MQVGDAAHCEPGNVADHDALCLGRGNGQGADCGGLVNEQQHGAFADYDLDDGTEFSLVLGQCPVEKFLALPVDSDRVVITLANININTNENIDFLVGLDQRKTPRNSVL